MSKKPDQISGKAKRRRAARLAAVQSLYAMELAGSSLTKVISDFAYRGGTAEFEEKEIAADSELYHDIMRGVEKRQSDLDKILDEIMQNREIARLEVVMRGILRCGTYEILGRGDIDSPVSISEYVTLATCYFDGAEPAFVNGVLDKVARTVDENSFDSEDDGEDNNFDPLEE